MILLDEIYGTYIPQWETAKLYGNEDSPVVESQLRCIWEFSIAFLRFLSIQLQIHVYTFDLHVTHHI